MNPVTHVLVSWTLAAPALPNRRDRALVTAAGVAPDLDGLGIVAEKLTAGWNRPLLWWSDYHHVLAHNLAFGLLCAAACLAAGRRRARTALLALVAFHLHLLGDIVGARGPDGWSWPIPYLWPFSNSPQLSWTHQWAINAWPNIALTALALSATLFLCWKRGVSPLEFVSEPANLSLARALRRRFGEPR